MTKAKTNALDALRSLIAERQQYDQWISALEARRDGTPEHVFNRVLSDYQTRLDRVVGDIRSHSEELELSITTLSARLTEVAKDEEAKRDSIQEAELRAAVGEYSTAQWESMRNEASRELEKIGADRASLEGQLAELESIRKLSEVTVAPGLGATSAAPSPLPAGPFSGPPAQAQASQPQAQQAPTPQAAPVAPEGQREKETAPPAERRFSDTGWPSRDILDVSTPPASAAAQPKDGPATPAPAAAAATPATTATAVESPKPSASPTPARPAANQTARRRTPAGKDAQISSGFTRPVPTPAEGRPEVNKTLKCPECGTANYPTEWYCERCGGELATM